MKLYTLRCPECKDLVFPINYREAYCSRCDVEAWVGMSKGNPDRPKWFYANLGWWIITRKILISRQPKRTEKRWVMVSVLGHYVVEVDGRRVRQACGSWYSSSAYEDGKDLLCHRPNNVCRKCLSFSKRSKADVE